MILKLLNPHPILMRASGDIENFPGRLRDNLEETSIDRGQLPVLVCSIVIVVLLNRSAILEGKTWDIQDFSIKLRLNLERCHTHAPFLRNRASPHWRL